MITLTPAAAEVKPAGLNTSTPALLLDLAAADDSGPADDDPIWDRWADEAACQDRLDAGLCPF